MLSRSDKLLRELADGQRQMRQVITQLGLETTRLTVIIETHQAATAALLAKAEELMAALATKDEVGEREQALAREIRDGLRALATA
jgi:hypothetical protein